VGGAATPERDQRVLRGVAPALTRHGQQGPHHVGVRHLEDGPGGLLDADTKGFADILLDCVAGPVEVKLHI